VPGAQQNKQPQASFFRALETQLRVIRAMLLRELQNRFGRDNIGYLWLILEPMMLATVISSVHVIAATGSSKTGMAPFPFTLVGYCLFIIFRGTFGRSDHLFDNASPLLYHHMIRPLDIVIVKLIVEVLGCLSSLIILMTIAIAVGLAEFPVRPLDLMFAALLISWLSFAGSMLVAAYTYDSHLLSRFVQPFSYFMVPLSGAFVTVSFLPPWAQAAMGWNPMSSIFEMARYGQFESASDRYIYWQYVVAFCSVTTYWGLLAVRRVRKRIRVA